MVTSFKGKVDRIYPDPSCTRISLKDVSAGTAVKTGTPDNYLKLYIEHPNYASVFSLLMASAVNKLPIVIWINADDRAYISQAIFDFPE